MKDLCEKDGNKLKLSIPKVRELLQDERFREMQVAAIKEAIRLIDKGFDRLETNKEHFEGKNFQSAPRYIDGNNHEMHHLCLSSLGGSNTIGTNVIPLLPLEHVQIHVLMMFFIEEHKNDMSAALMCNKKGIVLEDVLNSLENPILELNKDIYNLLVTYDRQSRQKVSKERKIKKEQEEDAGPLENYIQYRYTDEATEAYFQEHLVHGKNYKEWCDLPTGEVVEIKYRKFTKGTKEEDMRLKHHLNVRHRAERRRVEKAQRDFGPKKYLTMDQVKTLTFKDSDGDYAICSILGTSLGKIEDLQFKHLQKVCRACKIQMSTKGKRKSQKEMAAEVIDFLQSSEDLDTQFSQMNI
jgi:hypothetical protein